MKPVNLRKSFNLFWAASLLLLMLWIEVAKAGDIAANAQAEFLSPPLATTDRSLMNGDFFITAASRGKVVGDGRDESTLWAFDFRDDRSAYGVFISAYPKRLTKAELTLDLSSIHSGGGNDQVRISGLGPISLDTPAEGESARVVIDLLLHYSEQDILDALRGDNPNGTIFMRYEDDAIVRAARLALAY